MSTARIALEHGDFGRIAEQVLASGSRITFCAGGQSMAPFIRSGDSVTVAPAGDSLRIGDVILSRTAGETLLLHRIVEKREDGVLTMGDATQGPDGFVAYSRILGKVVCISGLGYNFHLRYPLNYLIAKRIIFSRRLPAHPLLLRFGKKVADLLG